MIVFGCLLALRQLLLYLKKRHDAEMRKLQEVIDENLVAYRKLQTEKLCLSVEVQRLNDRLKIVSASLAMYNNNNTLLKSGASSFRQHRVNHSSVDDNDDNGKSKKSTKNGESVRNHENEVEREEDSLACVICLEHAPMTCYMVCGHISTCVQCAKRIQPPVCPVCRMENGYFHNVFDARDCDSLTDDQEKSDDRSNNTNKNSNNSNNNSSSNNNKTVKKVGDMKDTKNNIGLFRRFTRKK